MAVVFVEGLITVGWRKKNSIVKSLVWIVSPTGIEIACPTSRNFSLMVLVFRKNFMDPWLVTAFTEQIPSRNCATAASSTWTGISGMTEAVVERIMDGRQDDPGSGRYGAIHSTALVYPVCDGWANHERFPSGR